MHNVDGTAHLKRQSDIPPAALGIDAETAYIACVRQNRINFPGILDKRYTALQAHKSGYLIPTHTPRFKINKSDSVFTIGSCFTRNIEESLKAYGCHLPVLDFKVPDTELAPGNRTNLLNEYNPGTTLQRVLSAYGASGYDPLSGIEKYEDGYVDLFLHSKSFAVTQQRLMDRRLEIDHLYQLIKTADVVVIALGIVESPYDSVYQCHLNRAPSLSEVRKFPGRYRFHTMNYAECLNALDKTVACLIAGGTQRIVLAVSPIPLGTTFSAQDAIIANGYSSSLLRCVTEAVYQKYRQVDYFPSFEIAASFGMTGYVQDNRHLNPFVTQEITRVMGLSYFDQ